MTSSRRSWPTSPRVPKVAVVAPVANPAPVIVTTVPPVSGPLSGLTAATVGVDW